MLPVKLVSSCPLDRWGKLRLRFSDLVKEPQLGDWGKTQSQVCLHWSSCSRHWGITFSLYAFHSKFCFLVPASAASFPQETHKEPRLHVLIKCCSNDNHFWKTLKGCRVPPAWDTADRRSMLPVLCSLHWRWQSQWTQRSAFPNAVSSKLYPHDSEMWASKAAWPGAADPGWLPKSHTR